MFKNTSAQKLTVFAFADAGHATLDPGEPVTGDASNITCKVEQDDDGTRTASNDTNPTEAEDGQYRFDLTQAETNGDKLTFYPQSSTAGVQVVCLPSSVIYTRPPNFSDLGIESDGDLTKVNALNGHTAQTGDSFARIGAPAGASLSADIATVKSDSAAILTDTGTTIPGVLGSPAGANMSADIAAVKAQTTAIETDTQDIQAQIGTAGAGLTDLGGMSTGMKAEVESEANDALVAQKLDHLVAVADADDVADDSIIAKLAASDGDWSGFAGSDDSLEAIRDHIGDGTNLTEAGGDGDHLTEAGGDGDHLTEAGGTGDQLTDLGGMSTAMKAEVEAEVQDAIEVNHLDHLLAQTYDPTSKPGASDALLNEMVENDGGVSRFTANALEQAPSGGGGSSPQLLQTTTIATLASQTSFTLTAGSSDDDAYNDAMVVVTDQSTGEQKCVAWVSDYTGSSKTITLESDPAIFTMATGDTIDIIAVPKQLDAAVSSIAAGSGPTVSEIRAEMDSNSTQLAAIVADTNELQADMADGGRVDLLVDAIKAKTDNLPSDPADASVVAGLIATAQADLDILTGSDGAKLATSQPNYAPNTTTPPTAAAIADAVHDEALSGHTTAGTAGERLGRIPNAAAGGNGGLPTVDASNRIAGIQGTLNDLDELDAAQDAQHSTTQSTLSTVSTNVSTLITKLTTGITSLAEWLGLLAGKQTGDATALTEIRATGAGSGTYDPTTDSPEAIRDHVGDGTNLTEAGGDGDHLTEAGGDGDHLTEAGGDGDHLVEAGGTGDQLTAVPWNSAWDTEVESEVSDALAAYGAAVTGAAMTLTSGERDAIANAYLGLADAIETGIDPKLAMQVMLAALAGASSDDGKEFYKAVPGGSTASGTKRIDATMSGKNRTNVALDGS